MPSLFVARLTIRSSYVRNVEQPADDVFDTIQLYMPDAGPAVFRIRTFAVDHDIHVHRFGASGPSRSVGTSATGCARSYTSAASSGSGCPRRGGSRRTASTTRPATARCG